MNPLRCLNCNGSVITPGENGAHSECAQCHGTYFGRTMETKDFTVLEESNPVHNSIRVIVRRACDATLAKQKFEEIHAVIDAA